MLRTDGSERFAVAAEGVSDDAARLGRGRGPRRSRPLCLRACWSGAGEAGRGRKVSLAWGEAGDGFGGGKAGSARNRPFRARARLVPIAGIRRFKIEAIEMLRMKRPWPTTR